MTSYPTIANCNYESADDDTIHRARLAAEELTGSPESIDDALAALESALDDELTESGEHRRGSISQEIIESAEADVISAYGDGPSGATWHGGRWVANSDDGARWDAPAIHCESGEATGECCQWTGEASELTEIEYMPEQHRASHAAAGNRGSYPLNGAIRIRVCPDCAEVLVDGDWCTEV